MQQTDRIELIKAAVELTKLWLGLHPESNVIECFDYYYDYLQLKLEATGSASQLNANVL